MGIKEGSLIQIATYLSAKSLFLIFNLIKEFM